jgi:hypothetical protein
MTTQLRGYPKEAFVVEKIATRATFQNDGTCSVRVRIQAQAGQQFGVLDYVRAVKPDDRIVETPAENILDMPANITREAPFYSDLKEHVAVKGPEDPLLADRLRQVFEKEGKKHDAAVAYAHTLSSTQAAPEKTSARWKSSGSSSKNQAGEATRSVALQDLRTTKLGHRTDQHASAEFFVLFSGGENRRRQVCHRFA